MKKHIINTINAPAPIGPYSQAVQVGKTLYVSGQVALHPKTGDLIIDTIPNETKQVMENLKAILTEAKATFDNVVMTTIFLSDMGSFAAVNEVYGAYFKGDFPARATVAVKTLPKNVNVEISVIASL
jgi:2-iminobutanoate/2-iminopropanoate deaminase